MNKRYVETIVGLIVILVAFVKGSDVKVKGVKVGSVRDIMIDQPNDRVVVTVSIQDHIDIPEDSSASITSEGLMGGKYISIEPSGRETLMQKDGSGVISSTQSSISLESLLGKYLFSAKETKNDDVKEG